MARGYDEHAERVAAVNALGRPLARRARSACELCGAKGDEAGRLEPYEVPPAPPDPDAERALLSCERCAAAMDGGRLAERELRFLEGAAWSEVPAVQVSAVRLLRRLAGERVDWAREALENLYLSPEIEEWAGKG